jgi:hypothetical protein
MIYARAFMMARRKISGKKRPVLEPKTYGMRSDALSVCTPALVGHGILGTFH